MVRVRSACSSVELVLVVCWGGVVPLPSLRSPAGGLLRFIGCFSHQNNIAPSASVLRSVAPRKIKMNYSEILGAARYHKAIAVLKEPRKSSHSFTGYCTDVFFNDPESMVRFVSIVEVIVESFLAVEYHQSYCRVKVPTVRH